MFGMARAVARMEGEEMNVRSRGRDIKEIMGSR